MSPKNADKLIRSKDDRRVMEADYRLDEYERKACEILTSDDGIKLQGRQCMKPEAVSRQIRHNMACRSFRRFGKDKTTMASAFFAIAFDMKKMCSKTARRV